MKKIREIGYGAYFIDGSICDVLLNRPIHDVDVTTGFYPEETKSTFHRTADIGIGCGMALVLEEDDEYEITTFRIEDVYVDHRRPSSVSFVRSLEEDLKRRGFTINVLVLDEIDLIIDKFNGLVDLEIKLLRAVGNPAKRFNEDALRTMRDFCLAASFDFDIESDTPAAMTTHVPLLKKISVEHSFIELNKLLMAPFWRKGIKATITSQAQKYLPYLENAHDNLQWLPNDPACDYHSKMSERVWPALPLALDVRDVHVFLKTWRTLSQFRKDVEKIVMTYRLHLENEPDKMEVYRYGSCLIEQAEALCAGFGLPVDFEHIERLDKELTIHDKHEIVTSGGVLIKELQYKSDPELGRVLKEMEEKIVLGELINGKEAISDFIRKENK